MPPKKTSGDHLTQAKEAIKQLSLALDGLQTAGDERGFVAAVAELQKQVSIESGAADSMIADAHARFADQRNNAPVELKKIAEKEKCYVRIAPPHAMVGCVRLTERKPGEWTATILDDVAVTSVVTSKGSKLAEACLGLIVAIEKSLEERDRMRKAFVGALEHAERLTRAREFSANLVMGLMAQGQNVRSWLSDPSTASPATLTRAQFGFFLADYQSSNRKGGSPRINFGGASQAETKHAHTFITVPTEIDPRSETSGRPVSSIKLAD